MTIEHRPREIQLTSKQLVFVFMSTVLVAVVVFLLGVWVGRGIGVDSLVASEVTEATVSSPTTKAVPSGTDGAPKSSDSASQPPLDYPKTLQGSGGSPNAAGGNQAQPPAPVPSPPPATITPAPPAAAQAPPPAPPPERPQPQAKPSTDTAESWVVQLGAFSEKGRADKVATEYRGKGYPVTVTPGRTFRVWIGPYPTKAAADQIAARLRKEWQDLRVIQQR
jgi:cell division septation protein DedD